MTGSACSSLFFSVPTPAHLRPDPLRGSANDAHAGKGDYGELRAEAGVSHRFVNFVEVTTPLFRTDKLLDFLREYVPRRHEPSPLVGFGIDIWFCQHLLQITPDPVRTPPIRQDRHPPGYNALDCIRGSDCAAEPWLSAHNTLLSRAAGGRRAWRLRASAQGRRGRFDTLRQSRG